MFVDFACSSEPFKVYPSFTLTSITLTAFVAEAGADDDSIVGYPKAFFPVGFGIREGDQAKWVSASITADRGCASESTAREGLVAYSVQSNNMDSPTNVTAHPKVSFTLTTPTIGGAYLQLCYKHQTEPYRLYASTTLRTRQLLSASVRAVGMGQILTAITESPQPVSFTAHGGMEGDRYTWIQPSVDGKNSTSETIADCVEDVEPAAGSSIGVSSGFYQEASFTFSETASDLILCYGPGAEPYMVYPAITMEVISPLVSGVNRSHVVVGRSTNVRFVGTFGITAGDAVKLAQNSDGDCSGAPAGGNEATFYPHATSAGFTGSSTGTSDVELLVSEYTKENRPFKLCYRFGEEGQWKMFSLVTIEAYEVTSVHVNGGTEFPSFGDLLDFTFTGTGILDGGEIIPCLA